MWVISYKEDTVCCKLLVFHINELNLNIALLILCEVISETTFAFAKNHFTNFQIRAK